MYALFRVPSPVSVNDRAIIATGGGGVMADPHKRGTSPRRHDIASVPPSATESEYSATCSSKAEARRPVCARLKRPTFL
jgi:hypothetical protein